MIVKDNLLRLRGFGATPGEYTTDFYTDTTGSGVMANTPSADEWTQPVLDKPRDNYVLVEDTKSWSSPPSSTGGTVQQANTESSVNWTGIVNAAGGFISSFFQPKQQQPIVIQQQKPMIPSWVLPVSIVGGAGLLAVAVLAKPRRGGALAGYSRRRKSRRGRR